MSDKDDNWQQQPSVLSRSTLYAPLAAYHQTNVPARDYLSTVKSLPRTVGEAALIRFVGNVSLHHHLTQESLHSKNTSARPLSENEVRDRLQQRGLTLVGGGFYTPKEKKNPASTSRRRRARKRKLCHPRHGGKRLPISQDLWKNEIDFVEKLNRKWNDYAWSILQPTSPFGKQSKPSLEVRDDIPAIAKRARLLSRTMEWVGARVRLDRCVSCREWVGCEGVLVADTKNTWEVFRTNANKQRHKSRLIVIPKQGSTLVVLLPVRTSKIQAPSTSPLDKPEVLCIVLEDNPS